MDNTIRKRSLESTLDHREKRCKFDEDVMMEPDNLGQTVKEKETVESVETAPAIDDFFPNISCAGYIQRMHSYHVTNSLQGPQFGVSGQLMAACGVVDSVQAKLAKSLNQVGQAILNCRVDQLNLQELTTFWFLVHVIFRYLPLLVLSNDIAEHDAQKLAVLAHSFNLCARFLGMVGWIDITDMELGDFRAPQNRELICEIHKHMKTLYDNIYNFFRSLEKAKRDAVTQGFHKLEYAEREFLTKH